MVTEHVVVLEGLDESEIPVRVRDASPPLLAEWAGTGPARGDWEAANEVRVDYMPPRRRAA
jgi:hypothetical protein